MGTKQALEVGAQQITPAFEDYRGVITNILSGREVRHVAVITQAAGTVRGNHYHPEEGGTQWLYLLSGRLEAFSCDTNEGQSEDGIVRTWLLYPGSLLSIPPWTAHAFRAYQSSVFLAIDEFSHAPERYSLVTVPYPLIPAVEPVR